MRVSVGALALALGWVSHGAAAQQAAPPLLHPMFQDHAVLQRDRPVTLWGDAAPGSEIQITLAHHTARTRADADGHWRAQLPALPAGGPHNLRVATSSAQQSVSDILIGDVWLCSGQSNMEFQVRHGLNADFEAASGTDPQMRLLTVDKNVASGPQRQFRKPVQWKSATPESVRDFSAACYFMGRDLRRSEKVPIGLIAASWGGTALDAWRSEASLASDPALKGSLALLSAHRADPAAASARFAEKWPAWWAANAPGIAPPWNAPAGSAWKPVPSFEQWEGWGVEALRDFNGIVFYRTEITLTPAQAVQGATLALGLVDDMDMSWVNGVGVGTNTAWGVPREYRLAPGTLRAGKNQIVVAIYDSWGGGGLSGTPEQRAIRFADGSSLPLPAAADWRYLVTLPSSKGEPPRAPWDGITGLAGIYNGMIAPIGLYGLRGVAWYQGESDTGRTADYAERLAGMMAGWRAQFENPKLPFLIAQLAGWGARNTAPVESGTAEIRDAQRRAAASDPHAAIAVTVDIGDVADIHPANKQDVGRRLARAAQAIAYGALHSSSGALPLAARREGTRIEIRFTGIEKTLATFSGAPLSFELCDAARGSCRFVPARITGETVLLDAGEAPATRVRYCWGGSPVCNLTDGSGLPVTPFELAVQ